MSKLTAKQLRFVEEYLIDSNATATAVRAGYSKKTAYSQGQRLLKNVVISAEINKRKAVVSKKKGIEFENKIEQQSRITDIYDELLILAAKDKLTSVEQAKYTRLQFVIKAADSTRAFQELSKHLGWSEQDNDKDVDTSFTIKIVGNNGNTSN